MFMAGLSASGDCRLFSPGNRQESKSRRKTAASPAPVAIVIEGQGG
jgi:hypothetical protein